MKDFYDLALLSCTHFRESVCVRRSSQLSITAKPLLKPNRLGLRKRTLMIQHELSNGVHSFAGAGSVKRPVPWRGSSPKSDPSLCPCFQPSRLGNHSRLFGSQADLGNEG